MSLKSIKACIVEGFEGIVEGFESTVAVFESIAALFQAVDDFLAVDQHEEEHSAILEFEDNFASLPSPSSLDPSVIQDYGPRFKRPFKFWDPNRDSNAIDPVFDSPKNPFAGLLRNNKDGSSPASNGHATQDGGDLRADGTEGATTVTRSEKTTVEDEGVPNEEGQVGDDLQANTKIVSRTGDGTEGVTSVTRSEKTAVEDEGVPNEERQVGASIHDYDFTKESGARLTIHDYDLSEDYPSREDEAGPGPATQCYYSKQEYEAGPYKDENDLNEDDAVQENVAGPGPSTRKYYDSTEKAVLSTVDDDLDEEYSSEEEEEAGSSTQHNELMEAVADASNSGGELDDDHASDLSGPVLSSCHACDIPDDDMMLACDKTSAHNGGDNWYHYSCVGLTAETVPAGDWYCPPCSRSNYPNQPKEKSRKTKKQQRSTEVSSKQQKKSKEKDTKAGLKLKDAKEDDPEDSEEPEKGRSKPTVEAIDEPGKPKVEKNAWKGSVKVERRIVKVLKEYQRDATIPEKDRFSEGKWMVVANRLLERYGISRPYGSIKNKYIREFRAKYGYDERRPKKRDPKKMRTSVESPENRKRKRQAKAEAGGEPLSTSRKRAKRRSRDEDDDQEDLDGTKISRDNLDSDSLDHISLKSNHGDHDDIVDSRNFEDYLEPHQQQYDWTSSKDKRKRKRDEEGDEQHPGRHAKAPRRSG